MNPIQLTTFRNNKQSFLRSFNIKSIDFFVICSEVFTDAWKSLQDVYKVLYYLLHSDK